MSNNKPFNIFDKPVPTAESNIHSGFEISAAEIADLKIQVARGLGHVKPADDAPDELANAVGEFGSATNPIGCASVPACIAFLQRLKTTDGHLTEFVRRGSVMNKSISNFPLDEYLIFGTDGKSLRTIFMSGYQRCDAKLAPEGFTLI